MTRFFRLTNVADKAAALRQMIKHGGEAEYNLEPKAFSKIETSPFVYWLDEGAILAFANLERVQERGFDARPGIQTSDNERFARLRWEVSQHRLGVAWRPYAKGGGKVRFYADLNLVCNWENDGSELKAFAGSLYGGTHWSKNLRNVDFFFRPGITWTSRTTSGLSGRIFPKNSMFDTKGCVVFESSDNQNRILSLLSIFNSSQFTYLVEAQTAAADAAARSYDSGLLNRTPLPDTTQFDGSLRDLALAGWRAQRRVMCSHETSLAFTFPAFSKSVSGERANSSALVAELIRIGNDIDQISTALFGFDGSAPQRDMNESLEDQDEDDETVAGIQTVLSWSVGVAFANFDIRLATGERAVPPDPDPFEPLPAKSPGMLPDGDAPFMSTSGIFVDDPGHPDDLAARVTAVCERVGEAPPEPDELRRILAKDFFPAHIRMYSKSRRKAPIYWQLATPSASYSVWLYIHAFGNDTLFRVQNDYVAPKLAHERRELEGMLAEAGASPSTAQSRAIEGQTALVEELSALLDEVKRVAPLWAPDLDDGVILNFAPLWRLVPQNRAWQKEVRAAWASLVDGDYDWAHLSMRLWPERVVPRCAKDRSLAIAHDLESIFWFEDAVGKWQPRPTPTRPVEDLIAERTSPAVKAALQSLLDAPDPVAASGRRKKS